MLNRTCALRFSACLALAAGLALASAPEAAAQEPDQNLVSAAISGDELVLEIEGGLVASGVSSYDATDAPYRIVLDILDVGVTAGRTYAGTGGLIDRVEIAERENDLGGIDTQVIVYTSGPTEHQFEVADGKITLKAVASADGGGALATGVLDSDDYRGAQPGAVSGPTEVSGRSLASLDFENLPQTSRVVIGTSVGVDYTSSQPDPTLVVVDIPGVSVPQSLTRVLDTTKFISPVRMVRAYRTRSGARVAITLSRDVDWKVVAGPDNLLYVDFDVPAAMQQQASASDQQFFDEVAPSANEQGGLGSYNAQETLITAGGQTFNPQSAFGNGAGAQGAAGSFGFTVDSSTATQQWTGRRINLDLVDADIHSVFRLISHVSRLNIVSSDNVSGTVTVRLENVPWDQALAAILQAKSLGAQQFGNIIRVAPLEVLKAEQNAALETQKAIEQLTPLALLVIPLNYATAQDVVGQIEEMLSSRGTVEFDERTNQIIIKETEERLAEIREVIRQLDRETPQVLIESRIVEANSNFVRSLGIQWGGEMDLSSNTGTGTGLFFPSSIGANGGSTQGVQGDTNLFYSPGSDNLAVALPADAAFGSLAVGLGSLTGLIDLEARLSAMETEGWGEVVSAPRITTLDNTAATITQGARIPFLSTSAGGTQVQFIEAALTLQVTPHITSDEKIFMTINVENNRPDFSNSVQGNPAIQIKEVNTELLIANGDTTVIGGVFATEENYSFNRVPFFSKVPLIGWMFRSRSQNTTRSEMLVFMTPRIVTREDN